MCLRALEGKAYSFGLGEVWFMLSLKFLSVPFCQPGGAGLRGPRRAGEPRMVLQAGQALGAPRFASCKLWLAGLGD